MKNYIKFIILALVLNSCGTAISNIDVEDRMEHAEILKLNKGDKIIVVNASNLMITGNKKHK